MLKLEPKCCSDRGDGPFRGLKARICGEVAVSLGSAGVGAAEKVSYLREVHPSINPRAGMCVPSRWSPVSPRLYALTQVTLQPCDVVPAVLEIDSCAPLGCGLGSCIHSSGHGSGASLPLPGQPQQRYRWGNLLTPNVPSVFVILDHDHPSDLIHRARLRSRISPRRAPVAR